MFLDTYFAVYQLPIQYRAASLMMIPILDLALPRTVPRHAARAAHEVSRFGKIGPRTAMITDAPSDAEPMRSYAIPTIHSLYCTVRALGNSPQINHEVQVFIVANEMAPFALKTLPAHNASSFVMPITHALT